MRVSPLPCAALLLILSGCGAEPEPQVAAGLHPSRREVLAHALARADQDGDGRIQQEEYLHFSDDLDSFRRHDADGDSAWSLPELEAALLDADPLRGMKLATGPQRGGGPEAGPGAGHGQPGEHRQRNGQGGPQRPPGPRRQP